MPNRIVRESLLDSSRYLAVDEGARLLYHNLLLLADDFGCLSLEHAFIGRRCFPNRPTTERLDNLLGQLAQVDLIRFYEHRGIRFGFIPRFRQRLKRETLKNPRPPEDLLADDAEAQEKFSKLNGHEALTTKAAAGGRNAGGLILPDGNHQADDARARARREGKGSEVKGMEVESKPAPAGSTRNALDVATALAEKMRLKESKG